MGVPPDARDSPGEGPRALATLSLANATGCDGRTLRVLPLTNNATLQGEALYFLQPPASPLKPALACFPLLHPRV